MDLKNCFLVFDWMPPVGPIRMAPGHGCFVKPPYTDLSKLSVPDLRASNRRHYNYTLQLHPTVTHQNVGKTKKKKKKNFASQNGVNITQC